MTGAYSLIAISIGATLGALARYGLSLTMNALVPNIPMGTLACNLIAAYIVGFAIAFFGSTAGLSVAWRLFLITGLAGGLSTFSTFSA
jgi:CrcB protein